MADKNPGQLRNEEGKDKRKKLKQSQCLTSHSQVTETPDKTDFLSAFGL
jgi:hypothetical protein